MKLSPPKVVTWLVALVLLLLGLLGQQTPLPFGLSGYSFWLVVASSVLLLVASLITGL
jgi:hypothetical protein